MFDESNSVADAVRRLTDEDPHFNLIDLLCAACTDDEGCELAAALVAHPNVVHTVILNVELTDVAGVELARYVAASSSLRTLLLSHNSFGEATYLAVAAALRVNTSLRCLQMYNNLPVDQSRVDAAFVDAMRLNPHRKASRWQLYEPDQSHADIDFQRLQSRAHQLGHPSLQSSILFLLEK